MSGVMGRERSRCSIVEASLTPAPQGPTCGELWAWLSPHHDSAGLRHCTSCFLEWSWRGAAHSEEYSSTEWSAGSPLGLEYGRYRICSGRKYWGTRPFGGCQQ